MKTVDVVDYFWRASPYISLVNFSFCTQLFTDEPDENLSD